MINDVVIFAENVGLFTLISEEAVFHIVSFLIAREDWNTVKERILTHYCH
jgi:hypothetical protein